ncbi:hypothetical protein [Listeria costaricensis]|uniref:hypothetical protein n=1 Tax=Listeria costaricensis TaxID=2026604 RepID=UPI000C07E904|nr:hypothetical protein [Listeria costaricensis]
MWFGNDYYNYVSKEVLASFENCYSNERIGDSVICITLYEEILDFENPINRERQIDFKRHIHFEKILQQLKVLAEQQDQDPQIEIETGKYPHGGIRLLKHYVDKNNELIPKSKATKVIINEYGKDGDILFQRVEELC